MSGEFDCNDKIFTKRNEKKRGSRKESVHHLLKMEGVILPTLTHRIEKNKAKCK